MKASDILFERGEYWICRGPKGKGFEVYRNGATAATRCAQIGFEGQPGLDRAKAEIIRRETA